MKIEYNKNWKPINENGDITDKDFDKRFEIDRQFIFNTLFRRYWVRFVKYPNKDKIIFHGAYTPRVPKFMSLWVEKMMWKEPYKTIWKKSCKEFRDEITELEMYSKYKYNYVNPKMIKRMEVLDKLLKE